MLASQRKAGEERQSGVEPFTVSVHGSPPCGGEPPHSTRAETSSAPTVGDRVNKTSERSLVARRGGLLGMTAPGPKRLSGGAECDNLGTAWWMALRCTWISAAPRDAGAYPDSSLIPFPDASRLRR
jgi:hypothetical protein